ncbi:MAG: AMP-binding protein, partial [bacterium]|nr:AMP-binding protein [bacterium]
GIAGRPHADAQGIVGMFVNTLAIRNYPNGERSYETLLSEVAANSINAFENQDVQFEDLVDRLDPLRDPSRNPVFDVALVVQNFQWRDLPDSPLPDNMEAFFNNGSSQHNTSKFDMTFFVHEEVGSIHINLEYYTGLFSRHAIQRLVRHFKNLVHILGRNPGIVLKELDVKSEAERQELLYSFNHGMNQTMNHGMNDNLIHRLIEQQAARQPEKTAAVCGLHSITYRELDRESNRLAFFLHHEKSIGPNTAVAIIMERSIIFLVAVLGVLKAGGAYIPIEPSAPEERIRTILRDACVGVVLSEKKYVRTLNRLQWDCATLHTYICLDSHNIREEEESLKNQLMDEKLWEYIGNQAYDDITGGGWVSSYTGEPFSRGEMDEYGDNVVKKVSALIDHTSRVLEIGCASGISMFRLAPSVSFYYGTDLSKVIIEKNRLRVEKEGFKNIAQSAVPAHQIDSIHQDGFHMVILNSVIQSFHGHNYLRQVIKKCIRLMADDGYLFIGDVMDQDLKETLIEDLRLFKLEHQGYRTKVDWSSELFVSRGFFRDLAHDFPEIAEVSFSRKIHTHQNELTRYRYDTLIKIAGKRRPSSESLSIEAGSTDSERHKFQQDLGTLETIPFEKPAVPSQPHHLAYLIYTSGTTGRPKGVMIEHRSLVNYIRWAGESYGSICGTTCDYPFHTSISFDLTVTSLFVPLTTGNRIIVYPNRESQLPVLNVLSDGHTDMIKATPSHLKLPDKELMRGNSRVKGFIVGGEELETRLAAEIAGSFDQPISIYNEYGPTEATVGCMIYRYAASALPASLTLAAVPIGVPITGCGIYILDRYMQPVPVLVTGELYISGVPLARGYINQPELTDRAFQPNPFVTGQRLYRTGDLARHLGDGNIEFLGRSDRQVKIRGYRIEIKEIENRLLEHEYIKEVSVIIREESGDLCCYWTAVDEQLTFSLPNIREFLLRRLPAYMVPANFTQLPEMPLTTNGKLDYNRLPAPGGMTADKKISGFGNEMGNEPGNKIEEQLSHIWAELLGIPHTAIGMEDNFFELGGHSLRLTVLVSKIFRQFNVKLPLAEVFKTPTIRQLALAIEAAAPSTFEEIEACEEREYYPLSFNQERLWIVNKRNPGDCAYNMPGCLELPHQVDEPSIRQCLEQLAMRHLSLRTCFVMIDAAPVQRVLRRIEVPLQVADISRQPGVSLEEIFNKEKATPFGLGQAPLFRAILVKRAEKQFTLIFNMHHIISDGWSMEILTHEFMQLYNGGGEVSGKGDGKGDGNSDALAPLKLQYKDYAAWQKRLFSDPVKMSELRRFWKSTLESLSPLNLPYDRLPGQRKSNRSAAYRMVLSNHLTHRLRQLSRDWEGSLFMVLLAGFNILLAQATGRKDISVAFPAAARQHEGLEDTIGMFVNTLLLSNHLDNDERCAHFFKRFKEKTVAALEYQDYPLELICGELKIRYPEIPVFFNMVNIGNGSSGGLSQLTDMKSRHIDRTQDAKFDLMCYVTEYKNAIEVSCHYFAELFSPVTVETIMNRYKALLEHISREPHLMLKEYKAKKKKKRNLSF